MLSSVFLHSHNHTGIHYILLHVGNLEETLQWKRQDRCLGRNNSSVVILTVVSTVITKGSLSSNARRYMRSLALTAEKRSIGMVDVEDSRDPTAARDS
jgi:hypothetical protein